MAKAINLTFDKQKNSSIDKTNIHNYIHKILFDLNSKISKDYFYNKLGIYLDDFKKIYIADYKRTKLKPDLIEYDFNIYPKSNVHKLKEREILREILYSKYSMFNYIIYGCILNTILDDLINAKISYYIFYFYIRVTVLKILSLLKKGTPIPINKAFYIVELKKSELKKIFIEENTKRKENGFNMNFFHKNYKIKPKIIEKENSQKPKVGTLNIDYTLSKEMFKESNKIFKEKKFLTMNIDFSTMTNQGFSAFTRERNINRGFLTKKQEKNNSFSSYRRIPDYAVYLSKKDRKKLKLMKNELPLIKIQKKKDIINDLTKIPIIISEKESEEGTMDVSKYKEIIFLPTKGEV